MVAVSDVFRDRKRGEAWMGEWDWTRRLCADCVTLQVFITDMANFAEMNGEYAKWFAHKPARSCVAVAALPLGVPVEIECEYLRSQHDIELVY